MPASTRLAATPCTPAPPTQLPLTALAVLLSPPCPPLQAPANNPAKRPRCVIVGSITGNTNTLAGNVPPKADLGDLRGLSAGLDGRGGNSGMIDGGEFDGAKAYKDSKVSGGS